MEICPRSALWRSHRSAAVSLVPPPACLRSESCRLIPSQPGSARWPHTWPQTPSLHGGHGGWLSDWTMARCPALWLNVSALVSPDQRTLLHELWFVQTLQACCRDLLNEKVLATLSKQAALVQSFSNDALMNFSILASYMTLSDSIAVGIFTVKLSWMFLSPDS